MNENATVNELVAQVITAMRAAGYSEDTIWRQYTPAFGQIKKFYREQGIAFYNLEVTAEFIRQHKERVAVGELTSTSNRLLSAAKRLDEFYLTGVIRVFQSRNKSRYSLSPENERLLDLFLLNRKYESNTQDDVIWIVRRYLCHWQNLGHTSMETVSMDDVRAYITKASSEMKPSSLYNLFLYTKHFHIFLRDQKLPAPDCVELFSYRVQRDNRIQKYITDEELACTLAVIDTETEIGKRDRAIILLGATTGLRACDIIRLKLTDIDWRNGRITLIQSKTNQSVYLPLMQDAGEALKDYILNARPATPGCKEVFLRALAPRTAIVDSMCIFYMFKAYQEKAGITREPFDGKGFHGLRRRLARKLLVSGSPTTTIAQILGHHSESSVRQYLSLDTKNLKECALDFENIPLCGEVLL